MRILIADDSQTSRGLLKVHLMAKGHEVVEAEDGLAAWEAWRRERFRMVITGWMMPNLAGPDLIQRIRSEPQQGYTYTIIVTALDEKSHVVEGLEAGADDYLSKPFHSEELMARVAIGERILQLEDHLREARQQMEFLAMHDNLTGLLNRRAIQEQAEAELKRAARASSLVSVLLIDLDHFKSVNDCYGHAVGDQALRMFAEILLECIRSYDQAGRWGGEEFLCVLPGTTLNDARVVAERVRVAVADATLPLPEGSDLKMTVSIGVAGASGASGMIVLDKLIQAADSAMYRAKDEGRNRICLAE
ncbi:MAG TPA: diguanylate cyclase [Anaerolineales bacterium]|nr:diguanylate cyclase [Anaerolineales bacterium]